jgi:hypothetical protein
LHRSQPSSNKITATERKFLRRSSVGWRTRRGATVPPTPLVNADLQEH